MPYCWKCGAKLNEDARFCPNCGTPVASQVTEPERRRPMSTLPVFLIALLVIAVIFVPLSFLPFRTVGASELGDVPFQAGVDTVNLDFTADVARVNIAFEDLMEKLVAINVSATGRGGILISPDLFELTFDSTIVNNVLTVTSRVDTVSHGWPWYSWLRVTCDLRIDPSMNISLNVKTSVGQIVMDTRAGVVLKSLSLEATTGAVEANLVKGVIVAGDISVKTTTGGVKFSWHNLIVVNNVLVNVKTTTGGVDVDVMQDKALLRNVTLKAEATTGGVAFAIDIQGDTGAKIESSTTTGGISVKRKVGFSGTKSPLQSNNYPAGNNFDVSLKTTTGGINIDAKYTP